MSQLFGVDVGGTFTDLVVLDAETGDVSFAKAPTTPHDPTEGVLAAIAKSDLDLRSASAFFHGTTLGINTVLEHKGAKTGVITTRGFRDVLEIARMGWPMYQLHWDQPPPLVPRVLRREVSERVRADGTVLTPFAEDEVLAEARRLVEEGVASIAVCFLHSYAFPQHERRAGQLIRKAFPGVAVTLSHQVTQEYREYERTATTVADAMIKPRMAGYLDHLGQRLRRKKFDGAFLITRCDGGVMGAREARERPIRTLISGPASGAMGGATLARWLEIDNLICADMGGTSFDAALIIGGEPSISPVTRIESLPLLVPVIELATIGAGGGSIAWIDAGGALNVGPQSAGADPGPICYGKGGVAPTFTDAALVSGVLDGSRFLGGEIALDLSAARDGIRTRIAEPLGLSVDEAAAGIVTLTEAKMAATLEELTIGKGLDPREFSLLAYGGGGPVVATALASRLGIPRVIVPSSPGTFSAWGALTLDVVHDFARTSLGSLATLRPREVTSSFAALEKRAQAALEREKVPSRKRVLLRSIDMRYEGQEHTLTLPVDRRFVTTPRLDRLREEFDARHEVVYGYSMADPVEVTAYRIRAVGSLEKPRPKPLPRGRADAVSARIGSRRVLHRESGGRREWAVFERSRLRAGNRITGPAIVEEPASTTLVGPGQELSVDTLGNLVISVGTRA
ncbi:MAG: hydantoinase/oxoprolinase family protein [Actinobacteria bacterium]|nr:hydantoinase/oxoprolinase family protein [Actinomycetota bacterium]